MMLLYLYNNIHTKEITDILSNMVYDLLMIIVLIAGLVYIFRNKRFIVHPPIKRLPSQILKKLGRKYPSDITIKNYPDPKTRSKLLTLISCMEEEQLFKNNPLKRKILAKKINTSIPKMNIILHRYLDVSFNVFVNYYRVDAVKKQLRDPVQRRSNPLFNIAHECGFRSKTSFVRIFKDFTGFSPIRYFRNLLKEERMTHQSRTLSKMI